MVELGSDLRITKCLLTHLTKIKMTQRFEVSNIIIKH